MAVPIALAFSYGRDEWTCVDTMRGMTRRLATVAFYAWLVLVPVLIGAGLVRRMMTLPYKLSIDEAISYAATTDALLWTGLVLNGMLPLVVAVPGWKDHRRLAIVSVVGAVVLYGVVGAAGAMSDAPLFGHWPTIEKP